MLLLTNCTFDGVVYNVERVMEQVLGHQAGHRFPVGRGMVGLRAFQLCAAPAHRDARGAEARPEVPHRGVQGRIRPAYRLIEKGEVPRMPDPDQVRIRVYATQSTHKTLTSMRQAARSISGTRTSCAKSEASFP